MPTATTGSLWREPNFARLWAGQTISQLGSQITFLALPLTAILVLDAGPAETGLLTAAGALPALLVGLHAGVMVDRRERLPILIGAISGEPSCSPSCRWRGRRTGSRSGCSSPWSRSLGC